MWIIICRPAIVGQSIYRKLSGIVGSHQKTGGFGKESLLVFQGQFPAVWWYW